MSTMTGDSSQLRRAIPSTVAFGASIRMYGRPAATPFKEFLDIAQALEDLGYDGGFSNDHFFLPRDYVDSMSTDDEGERPYFLDSWLALSAIAARTSRIRLGHQVTPLPLRGPAMIAKMASTIDLVSEGRFILGLGTGWNCEEYKAYGIPFEERFKVRLGQTEEGIRIIRELWSSAAPVSFRGQHYTLEGAPFWPKPHQGSGPPMWMGGTGRSIRQLIGARLDGWTPALSQHDLTPDRYATYLEEIRDASVSAGRPY